LYATTVIKENFAKFWVEIFVKIVVETVCANYVMICCIDRQNEIIVIHYGIYNLYFPLTFPVG